MGVHLPPPPLGLRVCVTYVLDSVDKTKVNHEKGGNFKEEQHVLNGIYIHCLDF